MGAYIRTRMWDLAAAVIETRDCECGAQKGERCRSLRSRPRYRDTEPVAQPHASRYPSGDRNIGSAANWNLLADWDKEHPR